MIPDIRSTFDKHWRQSAFAETPSMARPSREAHILVSNNHNSRIAKKGSGAHILVSNNHNSRIAQKGSGLHYPCDQCPRCYVGQIVRSLEQCFGEHHRALRKVDVLASTVAEHVFTLGHQMDFPRPGLWTLTLTPRPGVYWGPSTSNASRPLSTERRARCQKSTPLC